MLYKCRGCKESKERKEFHYKNFESSIPRKLCWDCEIKEVVKKEVEKTKSSFFSEAERLHETISKMGKKIRILERQNSISVPIPNDKPDTKVKHKSLNLYMEPDNKKEAWYKHKGSYRMYRTYPNQFIEGDVCVVVKRPYGGNKYYGLQKMYDWVMENKPATYKLQNKQKVESPF